MWPIKTCIFITGFLVACGLSLVYPIVGIVNYMMLYQVNPETMWWGKPLGPLGIRYSMTAATFLILGMLFSVKNLPRAPRFVSGWLVLLAVFNVVVVGSLWIGEGITEYGMSLADKTVKMSIFIACLIRLTGTRRNLRIVLWTLVFGSLLIGYDAYHAPASDFYGGRLNFVGGVDFRESSGLATHMAAMLPLIGMMLLTTPQWRWKIVALLSGMLAVNTMIQCRTRSAFVGLIAGVAVALILAPRARRKKVYAGLIVGLIGAYMLTDANFWTRVSTVLRPDTYGRDATIRSRMELWSVSRDLFLDHPLGVGVGQFREVMPDYNTGHRRFVYDAPRRVTHNTYLLCLTELGVAGSLTFAGIIILTFYTLRRCSKLARHSSQPTETRLMGYGLLVATVTYLVAAAFTDRLYTESFWWVLTLPLCLERVLLAEKAAASPALAAADFDPYEMPGEPALAPAAG